MNTISYQEKVTKYRRTLITISAEDIINTPNNADLGEMVRKKMWDVMETPPHEDTEMSGRMRTLIGVGSILFIFIVTYLIKLTL